MGSILEPESLLCVAMAIAGRHASAQSHSSRLVHSVMVFSAVSYSIAVLLVTIGAISLPRGALFKRHSALQFKSDPADSARLTLLLSCASSRSLQLLAFI